jgi:hypothetical protein
MIRECLTKLHFANILWKIDGFINVDVYGPYSHLKYPYFWTTNIYTVLEYMMLPASAVFEWSW